MLKNNLDGKIVINDIYRKQCDPECPAFEYEIEKDGYGFKGRCIRYNLTFTAFNLKRSPECIAEFGE